MTEFEFIDSRQYRTPSEIVLEHRKIFYSIQKVENESVPDWLCRIRDSIDSCEFGTMTDFILIDKFMCELGIDEVNKFKITELWSLEQLLDAVQEHKNHIESNEFRTKLEQIEHINYDLHVKSDVVSRLIRKYLN